MLKDKALAGLNRQLRALDCWLDNGSITVEDYLQQSNKIWYQLLLYTGR